MHTRPLQIRSRRAGFTLLEVIITGLSRHEFSLATDRVADLLTMYAQRDTLTSRPVGIGYDADRQELQLLLYTADDDGYADWNLDRFVDPVSLEGVIDLEALRIYADGESVNISEYPLTHTPGTERPDIQIVMQSPDGSQTTTLLLPPHALVPLRGDEGATVVELRRPVDLDEQGRSREDW